MRGVWEIFFPINIKHMAVIGVDLGGTKVAAAIFDHFGNIKAKEVRLLDGAQGDKVGKLVSEVILSLMEGNPRQHIKAIGVCVPTTLSPISTSNFASFGSSISMREPNLIKPNGLFCSACSPTFTYDTMRRATAPAIWQNNTSTPFFVSTTVVVRSLSVEDFGCQATRNLPG